MSEASAIRELDGTTIERIAAGEVVERPASAVKELVENSLDADADRIDVRVEGGGSDRIEVSDNGSGMTREDLRRAVRRHTTSKIRDVDDLEAGVDTLGFRGEALAAIGAVAKLTITSRPPDVNGEATEIRVEGGTVEDIGPAGRGPGTTVEVSDLFYNVPARREFLKAESTEFRHVNRVVTRYALANPGVAISLRHDGREVFATTGDGDRRAAVLAVYGRPVAESMIDVEAEPDGPLDRIHGLVSDPETTRAARSYLSTYVNGRYVEEGALREAIVEAYGGQLAADRFPFAALFVECPPAQVDPNVHPRKLSVRFEDEAGVTDAVEQTVREALLESGHVREGAPRGKSAPAETSIEHGDWEGGFETAAGSEAASTTAADRSGQQSTTSSERWAPQDSDPAEPEAAGPTRCSAGESDIPSDSGRRRSVAAVGRDDTLGDAKRPGRLQLSQLPGLEVLGQLEDTYLVAQTDDGLVLIDQHAADERINYEHLRRAVAGQPDSQALVVPVELDLTAAEAASLADLLPGLREMGFEAQLADERTATVTAVPSVLGETLDPDLLRDVLAGVLSADPADRVASAADAVLADLSCYPAITANTSLSTGSVVELLEALDDCENPYACPHGRPTMISIDLPEIEDRFERDYPGHQTRRPEDDGGE